ncbi:MAG: hypothetical protein KKG59_07700 [Nanoarchaeota archaeon]|nr:hypothetical protein [Nanoarchaeota archaeon]
MPYTDLQKQVYDNKIKRGFNVTDIGKEIILMTEELGELCDAKLSNDKGAIIDAIGDIMVYCLSMSSLFKWDAHDIIEEVTFSGDYLTHIGREIGMLAKTFKKSNQQSVDKIDRRAEFKSHLGKLLGYCKAAFFAEGSNELAILKGIVENNSVRSHQGKIK